MFSHFCAHFVEYCEVCFHASQAFNLNKYLLILCLIKKIIITQQ